MSKTTGSKILAPWKWWVGLLAVVVIYYCSQIISSAVLFLTGSLKHLNSEQTVDWLSNSIVPQFLFILMTEAIVVASIWLLLKYYKVGFKVVGLRRPRWSDLGRAVMVAPLYFVSFLAAVVLIKLFVPGFDTTQEQQIGFEGVHGNWQLLVTFLSLVILPPIAEELMARGVLFSSFRKVMPFFWTATITSIFFALPHLQGGETGTLLYVAGVDTFILGMYLAYLREKTGGLWASMCLHAIKNSIAFTALFIIGTR